MVLANAAKTLKINILFLTLQLKNLLNIFFIGSINIASIHYLCPQQIFMHILDNELEFGINTIFLPSINQ